MSDDLVKRLREDQPVTQDMESTMQCALQDEAADRIEELEAKLAMAVEALQCALYGVAYLYDDTNFEEEYADELATLAELTGETT